MAVDVVDLFEAVKIEHDEGGLVAAMVGCKAKGIRGVTDAAAVEAAGQCVVFGQLARKLFRFAPLGYFRRQVTVSPPSENHERDVEKQGVGQQPVGSGTVAGKLLHDPRQDRAAGTDEHDDCGAGNAQRHDIAVRTPKAR